MTSLFTSVNHNSQDVEEGQLPPDMQQEPVIPFQSNHRPLGTVVGFLAPSKPPQTPLDRPRDASKPSQESSSGQIVLEVVDDQFFSQRKSKKNPPKPPQKSKTHAPHKQREKEKERSHHERSEKDKKGQKNEKRPSIAPEKEELNADPHVKNAPYQSPYYPPYMYSTPSVHVQMSQYPPAYHPYSYPMPPYPPQHYPKPPQTQNQAQTTQKIQSNNQQNHPPNAPSASNPPTNSYPQPPPPQYPQYPPRNMPPHQQYPQYPQERPNEGPYKMQHPPMNMYNYPGGYLPMPYMSYEFYQRQREHHRQEQIRASRKREFVEDLRNELRRNVKDFNNDESLQILEAVKCILKFQDYRQPNFHLHNSSGPKDSQEYIPTAIAHRVYERSLQRVEKWLQGDNPNIREFMKGLLEAMQMGDVILKIKELKLSRKKEESLQSETKRLLDVLVRDPKKMIF